MLAEHLAQGRVIGDVETGTIERDRRNAAASERLRQGSPEHPAGAGDDNGFVHLFVAWASRPRVCGAARLSSPKSAAPRKRSGETPKPPQYELTVPRTAFRN